MSSDFPKLPEISCAYEHYDPVTLEPVNDSTYTRLIETGWSRDTFEGKSVLDLGCNSGILSLFAHSLGAAKISAVDIQEPFVDFFLKITELHNLPIEVSRAGFLDLDPVENRADVILFMEVLHWIVDQGGTIADAIARLAAMTNETLFLETPWDIKEPSIAKKGIVTEEMYNIELIIRELSRHFKTVKIEKFMTYFGTMENSKRVLISASDKRPLSLSTRHIKDANMTGISLVRGPNQIEIVTTEAGPKVLKRLPASSALLAISDDMINKLGRFLNSAADGVILAPDYLGDMPRSTEVDRNTYMMFPFMGALADYFPKRKSPRQVDDPLGVALSASQQLHKADAGLVDAFRAVSPPVAAINIEDLPASVATKITATGLNGFLKQVFDRLTDYDRGLEDTLVHHDLQTGNMVVSPKDGKTYVVDIDLMRSGTKYSDILLMATLRGVSYIDLMPALSALENSAGRAVNLFDISFSAGSALLWARTIHGILGDEDSAGPVSRTITGLQTLSELAGMSAEG